MPKVKKKLDYKKIIFKNLKEKYFYFLTGILILVIAAASIIKTINQKKPTPNLNSTKITKTFSLENKIQPKTSPKNLSTYVVQRGDHLWKIAEKAYGSGYNAYDIAKANNITNPSLIYAGQKLTLPNVEVKASTTGEIAKAKTNQVIKKINKYVVQKGDYLWKIAEIAYGDGMGWPRIAKTNKIENPDLIFSGQVLKIE